MVPSGCHDAVTMTVFPLTSWHSVTNVGDNLLALAGGLEEETIIRLAFFTQAP